MSDHIDQLEVPEHSELHAPEHVWMTVLGRALFGYHVEVHENSYFVNDQYILSLCGVERGLAEAAGKIILYGVGFSIFSIATANKALGEAEYFGVLISRIPFLTEFCAIVLSFFAVITITLFLDIFTITRMRIAVFSATGTESPNMRMVHYKGNSAWLDSLIPKRIGYSSNIFHRIIQAIGLVWAFTMPVSIVFIFVSAQLVCIYSLEDIFVFNLSSAMSWLSIFMSGISIFVFILVSLIPLKFNLKSSKQ